MKNHTIEYSKELYTTYEPLGSRRTIAEVIEEIIKDFTDNKDKNPIKPTYKIKVKELDSNLGMEIDITIGTCDTMWEGTVLDLRKLANFNEE